MTILCDTREPWPHPWHPHLPPGWHLTREGLGTGDPCVAQLPEGVVIERKTPADLAACIGRERERFERELRRGRYCGRFIVIVEGDLAAVILAARGIHRNAVVGTLAAWSVRFCPFIFAGDIATAAAIAFRALAAQVRDADRITAAIAQQRPRDCASAVLTLDGKENAATGHLTRKTANTTQ
jgi:DNA excision repair protein ERCC-4